METTEVLFDDCRLLNLVINDTPLDWPHQTFKGFPSCCGAGEGWGEKWVPDVIDDIILSPACSRHDIMYALARPSWADFHYSNSVFRHNLTAIFRHFSVGDEIITKHKIVCFIYFEAVDKLGGQIPFWSIKKEQGYELPFSMTKMLADNKQKVARFLDLHRDRMLGYKEIYTV